MKLVILDRDGVINQNVEPGVTTLAQWLPIAGSIEAIARLHQHGFTVVIATNQPGLSQGLLDLDDLEAIHARLTQLVEEAGGEIAAIFYCPHGANDGCNCHKPKTGLIDAIEAEFDTSASEAPLISSQLADLQMATAKDCDPILVRTGKGSDTEAQLAGNADLVDIPVFDDLAATTDYIISRYP